MNGLLIAVTLTLLASGAVMAEQPGAQPVAQPGATAGATKLRAQKGQMAAPKQAAPVHSDTSEPPVRIKREPVSGGSGEHAGRGGAGAFSSESAGANSSGPVAVFLERGKTFSRHGLYKEAAEYFTRAADADPNNVEAYNRRARAEWQQEQMKEALEDADWAIKLNPDCAEAFCTRAAVHNSMSQYQDAVADAGMARDLNANLRDAYMLQAVAYRNLGQHREADDALNKLKAIAEPQSAFDESQPNVDYSPYLTYLQETVRRQWNAPPGAYAQAVALFKIHRSGQITDLRLNNTTGDNNADSAAVAAVKSCVPFREPPAGTPPDFDVYIVLEPARPGAAPGVVPGSGAPGSGAPAGVGQFNMSGAVNQGIGIMRRYIPIR